MEEKEKYSLAIISLPNDGVGQLGIQRKKWAIRWPQSRRPVALGWRATSTNHRGLRRVSFYQSMKCESSGTYINWKWQKTYSLSGHLPRVQQWYPWWCCWVLRSQGSVSLQPWGPEDPRGFPVEEELGDWPTLRTKRRTVGLLSQFRQGFGGRQGMKAVLCSVAKPMLLHLK